MFRIAVCPVALVALTSQLAMGQVQVFHNNFAGFEAAAGPPSIIDFETLPNGAPTIAGISITETFNYDASGVHLSVPIGTLITSGNSISGHGLLAESPSQTVTSIIADLITPGHAVGAFFGGTTELCAYDLTDQLIDCTFFSPGGSGNFIGIVSTTPIKTATFHRGQNVESIQDFVFVPEPASAALLAFAAAGVFARRKRGCVASTSDRRCSHDPT